MKRNGSVRAKGGGVEPFHAAIEIQPVGYGAIAREDGRQALMAPNPPCADYADDARAGNRAGLFLARSF